MATEMTYDEIIKERKKNIIMQRFRLVPGDKKNGKELHEANLRFLKLYNIPTSELWAIVGEPKSVSAVKTWVDEKTGKPVDGAIAQTAVVYRFNVRTHLHIDLISDLMFVEQDHVELLPEFETMDKIEIYNIPGPVNV